MSNMILNRSLQNLQLKISLTFRNKRFIICCKKERIFDYRLKEYSITKMAMLENCSESTINREIKKIKRKISKVI